MSLDLNFDKYRKFVAAVAEATKAALPNPEPASPPPLTSQRPLAMLFSPHPDDEVLTGGLALRLWQEAACQVVNIPMSFGSDPQHREQRKMELNHACGLMGFGLLKPDFLGIHYPPSKKSDWDENIRNVGGFLEHYEPDIIICPHAKDRHRAHTGTHHLVIEALVKQPINYSPLVIFSESYAQNPQANLMVELGIHQVAQLVRAMGAYRGALERHPYDRMLPAHLMAKIMYRPTLARKLGVNISNIQFADLYQTCKRENGKMIQLPDKILRCSDSLRL